MTTLIMNPDAAKNLKKVSIVQNEA